MSSDLRSTDDVFGRQISKSSFLDWLDGASVTTSPPFDGLFSFVIGVDGCLLVFSVGFDLRSF